MTTAVAIYRQDNARRYLSRKQILEDQLEQDQKYSLLGKGGEANHKKEVVPDRRDLKKVCLFAVAIIKSL